jgi:DNA-binding NarL/FixJ family response regulator
MSTVRRVRVAAVNDYELVVDGLAALLGRFPDRLEVVDRILVGEPVDGPVDVALYDTYGRLGIAAPALRTLAASPDIAHVAVFSLNLRREVMVEAVEAGASGFISKGLSGTEIAEAIVRIAAGRYVEAAGPKTVANHAELDWPGRDAGLTERESEVLVLAAEGWTNPEIAAALYVGVETVKTHLHRVYAKLGLRNRVEAATFVEREGAFRRFGPRTHPSRRSTP